tara:strand:+ start:2828 stop:2935 length:108 start_codon:yes stop_codon:yes gene_type:complete
LDFIIDGFDAHIWVQSPEMVPQRNNLVLSNVDEIA